MQNIMLASPKDFEHFYKRVMQINDKMCRSPMSNAQISVSKRVNKISLSFLWSKCQMCIFVIAFKSVCFRNIWTSQLMYFWYLSMLLLLFLWHSSLQTSHSNAVEFLCGWRGRFEMQYSRRWNISQNLLLIKLLLILHFSGNTFPIPSHCFLFPFSKALLWH